MLICFFLIIHLRPASWTPYQKYVVKPVCGLLLFVLCMSTSLPERTGKLNVRKAEVKPSVGKKYPLQALSILSTLYVLMYFQTSSIPSKLHKLSIRSSSSNTTFSMLSRAIPNYYDHLMHERLFVYEVII